MEKLDPRVTAALRRIAKSGKPSRVKWINEALEFGGYVQIGRRGCAQMYTVTKRGHELIAEFVSP